MQKCCYQAPVTVEPVMEKTITDLTKWFLAIYLAVQDKVVYPRQGFLKSLKWLLKLLGSCFINSRQAKRERGIAWTLTGIEYLDDASLMLHPKAENADMDG